MSQTWPIPIDSTDLLSASRTDLNSALDALLTTFIGGSDPTGAALVDGLIWINSGSPAKLRARKSGATIELGDFSDNLGHVRKDGSVNMIGDLNMGSKRIVNLQAPVSSDDAARYIDVLARLPLNGGTLSGAVGFSGDYTAYLNAGNHVATIDKLNQYVTKAGSTMTGALYYPTVLASPPSANKDYVLRRDDIENLTTFNTATGHRHNGSDSKSVSGIHIAALQANNNNEAAGKFLHSVGDGTSSWLAGILGVDIYELHPTLTTANNNTTYQTVDCTGFVTAGTKKIAVKIDNVEASNVRLRKFGSANNDVAMEIKFVFNGEQTFGFVELDTNLKFEWRSNTNSANNVTIRLVLGIR